MKTKVDSKWWLNKLLDMCSSPLCRILLSVVISTFVAFIFGISFTVNHSLYHFIVPVTIFILSLIVMFLGMYLRSDVESTIGSSQVIQPDTVSGIDSWNISNRLSYYSIVRSRISSLDDLSTKTLFDGASFGIAIIGVVGFLFEIASVAKIFSIDVFKIAAILSLISYIGTESSVLVISLYTQILGTSVKIAKKIEDKLELDTEIGLSYRIDKENTYAGSHSWLTHTLMLSFIAGGQLGLVYVLLSFVFP